MLSLFRPKRRTDAFAGLAGIAPGALATSGRGGYAAVPSTVCDFSSLTVAIPYAGAINLAEIGQFVIGVPAFYTDERFGSPTFGQTFPGNAAYNGGIYQNQIPDGQFYRTGDFRMGISPGLNRHVISGLLIFDYFAFKYIRTAAYALGVITGDYTGPSSGFQEITGYGGVAYTLATPGGLIPFDGVISGHLDCFYNGNQVGAIPVSLNCSGTASAPTSVFSALTLSSSSLNVSGNSGGLKVTENVRGNTFILPTVIFRGLCDSIVGNLTCEFKTSGVTGGFFVSVVSANN